ncbi:hypothetical protein EXU29_07005 [Acinetobacter wuhouensis]|uniref:hypothetical protein n=1 Tax=Acinetobacter wuhouensis TaxID=1879050 RepID=UPI001022B70D|nr:hypothetical protein [Acinetobacter wuhouensis]RZG73448.1 hypothetical protein EXU29_07005 [Acinetobacter wuhouensis]
MYPLGVDCVWIAVDQHGMLGVFLTAGEGAIPLNAIQSTIIELAQLEKEILQLPITSLASLQTSVPRPDDFIAFAERGFFVYDYSSLYNYELVCLPKTPLYIQQLPNTYANFLQHLILKNALYKNTIILNIKSEFNEIELPH